MAEFQSMFTGQEVDNAINKLRNWIAVDSPYPTVTISGSTYAVIWKVVPTAGNSCYGIGLHATTGRPYQIYYNGSSYSATAFDLDTKNTTGSTNSTSKLFLVGAGSQASDAQTYSNNNVYTQGGTLYLTRTQDLSGTANNKPALIVGGTDTSAHLEFDSDEIHAKANGTTVANLYLNNDGGTVYLAAANGSSQRAYASAGALYSEGAKVLTAHPTISTTSGTSSSTLSHGGTFTALSSVTKDSNGHITNMTTTTYTLPSDNDTKNTAGSTNSTSKLFLVGAGSQAANPQTYSNSNVYTQNGGLYATTIQAATIKAKTSSSATDYGTGQAGQVLISNGTSTYWGSNVNADTVDNFHMTDQSMAYNGSLDIKIGCVNAVVQTGKTEAEIFALSGSLYGKLYLASDTNKYYRRHSTSTGASSSYWTDVSTLAAEALALPNQLTTEDYVYIKVDLKQMYYGNLVRFYVTAGYDNTNGSTTIIGFCRAQNNFEITACNYNGNNLKGIYQVSSNTDVYIFKFNRFQSSYGGGALYINPIIKFNQYSGTPAITFIDKNHADYNTVKAYSYKSVPAQGVSYYVDLYDNGTILSSKYIAKSLISTKGDIIYASAANTPARLAIGSNGKFLSISDGIPAWVNNPNTDKKAASSNSDSKLFLIGASSQSADGQATYSHSKVYETNGALFSDSLTLDKADGAIYYQGTQAKYSMIRFKDNTNDTYGNGIVIGGGGAVVIGSGESSDAIYTGAGLNGGTETLYLGSDGDIHFKANVQSGYASAKTMLFSGSDGSLAVPGTITSGGTAVSLSTHTHTTSLAQSGSSGTTLSANTWYTLTAGGTTVTFKTPANDGQGVTSVATGVGLTGGTITSTGTIKAKLVDETANTAAAARSTSTDGGLYAIEVDKDGKLAVRVPWKDTDTKVTTVGNHYTPSGGSALTPTSSGTATRGSTIVMTGITKDAAGHITGVTGYTLPASDNTNTATAADNILDGSNSGTQITYAPYSAQQSKLSFDTSTSNPTRTDRLNLNGYLYATKFNVTGKATMQYNTTEDCIEFIFA